MPKNDEKLDRIEKIKVKCLRETFCKYDPEHAMQKNDERELPLDRITQIALKKKFLVKS